MKLAVNHITEILQAEGRFAPEAVASGYSIDTRTIQPADLFFAVKGERLDGHDFVQQALAKGAVGAVVQKDRLAAYQDRDRLISVDGTLRALQTLATAVRKIWGKTVVGVTGSVGKTTTKEAIAHVLGSRWRVLKSEGNFNNHFGLPLMLLRLAPEHDVAVIEIGMSHRGEIAALARIAQPQVGVVTAVAPVHLEFFSSVEEIAQAKQELVAGLPDDGVAVLNADDGYVSQFGRHFTGEVITYAITANAKVRAENVADRGAEGSAFDLVATGQRVRVLLPLVGRHNISNALAAAAVGLQQGLFPAEIAAELATLAPADKRGQVLKLGNITVINDCYNSNPRALDAMVDALSAMPAARRIVVAGEMLELGPSGEELHRECGRHLAARRIDVLLGVRGLAQAMVEAAREVGMRAEFVASAEEAGDWLAREARDGDAVLLKASRGVKLERALKRWLSATSLEAPAGAKGHRS
jgi:UDP-N-acetylmuramoyl-tripeptide--D-alanyl-D-alanine ligase